MTFLQPLTGSGQEEGDEELSGSQVRVHVGECMVRGCSSKSICFTLPQPLKDSDQEEGDEKRDEVHFVLGVCGAVVKALAYDLSTAVEGLRPRRGGQRLLVE